MKDTLNKIYSFLDTNNENIEELLELAFSKSIVDFNSQASCLFIENNEITIKSFSTNVEAFLEMEKHNIALFIPTYWHLRLECDWVWTEEDENGENLLCCNSCNSDNPYNTCKFKTAEDLFNFASNFPNSWAYEVYSRVLVYIINNYNALIN